MWSLAGQQALKHAPTGQAVPVHPRRLPDLAPERLGTELAHAMLPPCGRAFRRTVSQGDMTTNRKNIRDAWAADAVFG